MVLQSYSKDEKKNRKKNVKTKDNIDFTKTQIEKNSKSTKKSKPLKISKVSQDLTTSQDSIVLDEKSILEERKEEKHTKNDQFSLRLKRAVSIFGILFLCVIFFLLSLQLFVFEHSTNDTMSLINNNFENEIQLLAVNSLENGTIVSGSTVPLKLHITQGSGEVFVNLNSYTQVDTQISITNSNKVVCEILELPCDRYNFFYSFDDSTLVLKGPSASTSIAVLTYATIKNMPLEENFVLTGSLSSNGIIGMVGGVKEKVKVAQDLGVEKVFIPYNGLNDSLIERYSNRQFEVIEVLDIVSLLEYVFELDIGFFKEEFMIDEYKTSMKNVAQELCSFSENYLRLLSNYNYTPSQLNDSLSQLQNSKIAFENQEYYSQGSFCYSANIGLKSTLNRFSITDKNVLKNEILNHKERVDEKKKKYDINFFKSDVESLNDLYVYLLVKDRIQEAYDLLNSSSTILQDIAVNYSNYSRYEIEEKFNQSVSQLSVSQERFITVLVWETLFDQKSSKQISITPYTIERICTLQLSQIQVLQELLKQYNIGVFTSSIERLEEMRKKGEIFLCVYSSLELKGQMNSVIGSVTIENDELEDVLLQLEDVSLKRMQIHSQGEVPLIPYIYYEYSQSLKDNEEYGSALQYIYSSLSFSELNVLFDSRESLNESNMLVTQEGSQGSGRGLIISMMGIFFIGIVGFAVINILS